MEFIDHHGRATAYRLVEPDASGLTVLYVHGSGGTHRVWGHQYGSDGPTHPAAALDLSGHGDSADLSEDSTAAVLEEYARDVVAVADSLDVDVLVGNSLGGAVVQRVATNYDAGLSAVVLLGTGPTLPVYEGLRDWLDSDFQRAVEFLHGRDRLFHDTDLDAVERSREQMHAVGQRVTRRDFTVCHGFDGRDRLPDIEIPVLAVCGEHDKLTPRSYHEEISRAVPNGEFTVVPDAAHLAMVEQPGIFNDIVEGFLDGLA